ncbi:hypothetical protein Ade02nite_58780 [Paractinoplanes deccanensis]|uniref:Uncharacterized protein n=1 Tax=Paractinoplanes deccanensis TaxID=113561 RepID=A0ABQ3YB31_9ACTN|nr:hypothetical protein [Actinoplanes deccanensis]GID77237.1 hypothetical protein Ade02nite_58780 [Actinoplanes deccanensis]
MTGVVAGPGPGILAGIAWANFMNSVLPRIMMTAEQEALLTEPVSGDVPFEFRVRFGLRVADSEQERLVPWQCGASATPGQT